jgi:hypothetical protein
LAAIEFAATSNGCEAINVGTGHGATVIEMVKAFEHASGRPVPYEIGPRREGDVARSLAAVDKAERLLGWKANLTDILENYAQVVEETDERGKKKPPKQLFPRFHQLDVVRKLLADAEASGAGRRYLIQHSAGSGKSNSIAWLGHQLIGLETGGKPTFDTVIVVTDRRNLDKQIRDTIKQFAQVSSIVGAVTEGSQQLWCHSAEDDLVEAERRLAATLKHFKRDHASLGGRLFLSSGRDLRLKLVRMGRNGAEPVAGAADAIVESER